jgi:hypothetical protein
MRRKKKNKNRRKIKEVNRIKEKGRVLWLFQSLIHVTQPEEAVLLNVSLKQF